ncbi:MAG TPA: hypothetical protein VK327_18795 [Candidatus Paceibacterota bacterium]|nr:hypothetical protein [Candidatus Paceibacterota bacterium]
MNLDEAQRKKVAAWIQEGLKLSDIQNRIASELGLRLTYMDVRLLVDDLKLTPKDVEPPKVPTLNTAPSAPAPSGQMPAPQDSKMPPAPTGGVSVTVDQLARPGAMVSGKVTFTDGNAADWYIDQTGRLGLVPQQAGYRPPTADVQQFQMALEAELSKMGI